MFEYLIGTADSAGSDSFCSQRLDSQNLIGCELCITTAEDDMVVTFEVQGFYILFFLGHNPNGLRKSTN